MKHLYTLAIIIFMCNRAFTQVGIGTTTPNSKAVLDITGIGKGLLIPRMDSATRVQIQTPLPDGLMVFQTDHRKGFWYAVSNTWLYIPDKLNSGDNLGSHTATQSIESGNYDIRLGPVGDNNHGVGWYGNSNSTKNWLLQNIDGPVIYGFGGGTLGTRGGGSASILSWRSNGRVGINNPNPQYPLDVMGTTRSQQYTYHSPQTRYLSIPFDAFTSADPDAYRTYRLLNTNGINVTTAGVWLTGGVAGQPGYISAPVNLPHGAVITNISITGINNDATTVNTGATLSAVQTATNGTSAYGMPLNSTVIFP